MRIGIDFDNTIAGYDNLFARLVRENVLFDEAVPNSKREIRDALRQRGESGELDWQRLQALAYGPRMDEAELIEGVYPFLAECRRQGHRVFIISHKTRYARMDPDKTDMRQAALRWMTVRGFFEEKGLVGLNRDQIFFEDNRQAKIGCVRRLKCNVFIDDLEEVFKESTFPRNTEAILYLPIQSELNGRRPPPGSYLIFSNWADIQSHVLGAGK